jgi:hypothetical protein
MRKLSAHYLYPVSSAPVRYGTVVTDDRGVVQEILDPGGEMREVAGTIFYSGILVPAFWVYLESAEEAGGEEDVAAMWRVLGAAGCRGGIVAFRERIVQVDLLEKEVAEVESAVASELQKGLVVVRKEGGRIPMETLFPLADVPLQERREAFARRLRSLTLDAARLLGVTDGGCIAPGCRPGLVVLEMDFGEWRVKGRMNDDR